MKKYFLILYIMLISGNMVMASEGEENTERTKSRQTFQEAYLAFPKLTGEEREKQPYWNKEILLLDKEKKNRGIDRLSNTYNFDSETGLFRLYSPTQDLPVISIKYHYIKNEEKIAMPSIFAANCKEAHIVHFISLTRDKFIEFVRNETQATHIITDGYCYIDYPENISNVLFKDWKESNLEDFFKKYRVCMDKSRFPKLYQLEIKR